MTLLSILIIAIALSVDAFSVSLTIGMCNDYFSTYHKFRYYAIIGLFHIFMMFVGWYTGGYCVKFIEGYSHWLSFVLIMGLGLKMIIDGICITKGGEVENIVNLTTLSRAMMFGVMLSLDAVVAGITISTEKILIAPGLSQFSNAVIASIITGIVVFFITWLGVGIGYKARKLLGKYSIITGGGLLIAMGIHMIIEHFKY